LQKPNWRPRYQLFEDSILIEHPDTTKPPTAAQQKRLAELRRRQLADSAEADLRWNWNTPFFLSAHSPTTFYAGSNKVMKSTNRGENLYPISPDLTTRERRARGNTVGPSRRARAGRRTRGAARAGGEASRRHHRTHRRADRRVRPRRRDVGRDLPRPHRAPPRLAQESPRDRRARQRDPGVGAREVAPAAGILR